MTRRGRGNYSQAGAGVLHPDLAARIEWLLGGPLRSVTPVAGGYTPALRLLCATERGRFFVKVGANPVTAGYVRREIQVYNRVSGAFMPDLVGWDDHPDEPILAIEDLSMHRWPPPWDEAAVERVLVQVEAMHRTAAPLEPFAAVHGGRVPGWHVVASDPQPFLSLGMADAVWLEAALPALMAHEARCPTEGRDLAHWDLRSDNICLRPDRAVFVDWNLACLQRQARPGLLAAQPGLRRRPRAGGDPARRARCGRLGLGVLCRPRRPARDPRRPARAAGATPATHHGVAVGGAGAGAVAAVTPWCAGSVWIAKARKGRKARKGMSRGGGECFDGEPHAEAGFRVFRGVSFFRDPKVCASMERASARFLYQPPALAADADVRYSCRGRR